MSTCREDWGNLGDEIGREESIGFIEDQVAGSVISSGSLDTRR